jgi:hypothetical protein
VNVARVIAPVHISFSLLCGEQKRQNPPREWQSPVLLSANPKSMARDMEFGIRSATYHHRHRSRDLFALLLAPRAQVVSSYKRDCKCRMDFTGHCDRIRSGIPTLFPLRYSEANVPRGANTTETKTELLDQRQQRGGARDHLSRLLNAIDKFVRVINDPNQLVPINYIDLWEVDTCSYLRANLSEADKTFL